MNPTSRPPYVPTPVPTPAPRPPQPTNPALAGCDPQYDWVCGDQSKCIDKRRLCDGFTDCPDQSDERDDTCIASRTIPCLLLDQYCQSTLICWDFQSLVTPRGSFPTRMGCGASTAVGSATENGTVPTGTMNSIAKTVSFTFYTLNM